MNGQLVLLSDDVTLKIKAMAEVSTSVCPYNSFKLATHLSDYVR